MAKILDETKKRDIIRAATMLETASIVRKSKRHVRRVMDGDNDNDVIEDVFMFLTEGKNKLIEEAKKLVPFPETNYKKAKA